MENDLIINKILNNETVQKVFKISYYKDVYQFFEDYLEFYNPDFQVRRNLQNKLFIEYGIYRRNNWIFIKSTI